MKQFEHGFCWQMWKVSLYILLCELVWTCYHECGSYKCILKCKKKLWNNLNIEFYSDVEYTCIQFDFFFASLILFLWWTVLLQMWRESWMFLYLLLLYYTCMIFILAFDIYMGFITFYTTFDIWIGEVRNRVLNKEFYTIFFTFHNHYGKICHWQCYSWTYAFIT